MQLMRLTVVGAIAVVGAYTFFIGVRDGLVRRRISSHVHRDGRELRGTAALLHGAATTAVGVVIAATAIWIGLEILRKAP
jgi:hypothetical protein